MHQACRLEKISNKKDTKDTLNLLKYKHSYKNTKMQNGFTYKTTTIELTSSNVSSEKAEPFFIESVRV